ncbi:RNA polymerase sigma factor [Parabacteroides sp. 52]|uniref:RNA polymerase sigma factor n=1 Tax=unclassified Parabacteroides TaxID=2649774 RepID=UPI0013D477DD|nr:MULTISPECIES: RNA polymerase sigma factor [unclassified Parabacteroides]MDH6534283.1 RNA polymerase sigma-70 factor (ECF subfamily) [Parabacteroides sp. PM5-20]NDV55333.1 RNA polymerase sigma factor [Parabacteroides sp. 52]
MEFERFKITVLPLREKIMRISLRLIEEKEDAEDIVQEVFLKLWHIRDQLDQYKSVEALAVTMTKNLTLDKIKRQKPQGNESDLFYLEADTLSPAEQLEQKEAVECIRQLIGQLPSLQQTIIRMKDIEGYELAEIADITGSNIEAIRTNLSRARKRVREAYIKITMNTRQ